MENDKPNYIPTEDEEDEIDMAGLSAAFKELQVLKIDGLPIQNQLLACFRAIEVAMAACFDAKKDLLKKKKGFKYISYYPDALSIVCSAITGLGDDEYEVPPYSVAGHRVILMIKAASVLQALSNIGVAMDEDCEVFGQHCTNDAILLAKKRIKNSA